MCSSWFWMSTISPSCCHPQADITSLTANTREGGRGRRRGGGGGGGGGGRGGRGRRQGSKNDVMVRMSHPKPPVLPSKMICMLLHQIPLIRSQMRPTIACWAYWFMKLFPYLHLILDTLTAAPVWLSGSSHSLYCKCLDSRVTWSTLRHGQTINTKA